MIIESGPAARPNPDDTVRSGGSAQDNAGFPLSGAQLGIWFAQRLNPSSAAYNSGEYVEIRGGIVPALFERALRQVVDESETLRVLVKEHEGEPRQFFSSIAWT